MWVDRILRWNNASGNKKGKGGTDMTNKATPSYVGVILMIVIIVVIATAISVVIFGLATNTNYICEQNGVLLSTNYHSVEPTDHVILYFTNATATYFIPSAYYYSATYDYYLQIGNKTSISITHPNLWTETTVYGGESECAMIVAINRTSGEKSIMNYSGHGCYDR